MVDLELGAMLDHALYTIGWAEVSVCNAVIDAVAAMASDPQGLAREIIIQVIMFALTTIVLGGLYHRFVLVPQERKAVERRSAMLEPFRRMLVTRIANTHSKLLAALSERSEWPGNWGRPTIRTIRMAVANLYADFASAVLSNQDLLEQDEQYAVGKYSELLFTIQSQLDAIEQQLPELAVPAVTRLGEIIEETDGCVLRIAEAFDGVYAAQITDLTWEESQRKRIADNLLAPIARRAERIEAQLQAQHAATPAPMPVPAPTEVKAPSPAVSFFSRLFRSRTPVVQ